MIIRYKDLIETISGVDVSELPSIISGMVSTEDNIVVVDMSELKITLNTKEELDCAKQKEIFSLLATAKTGVKINADKESIENIKTAILALEDGESTMWIAVDNQSVELTKEDLKTILRDIGTKTSEIVFRYRSLKDELLND